jgi:hypothetical protein
LDGKKRFRWSADTRNPLGIVAAIIALSYGPAFMQHLPHSSLPVRFQVQRTQRY